MRKRRVKVISQGKPAPLGNYFQTRKVLRRAVRTAFSRGVGPRIVLSCPTPAVKPVIHTHYRPYQPQKTGGRG